MQHFNVQEAHSLPLSLFPRNLKHINRMKMAKKNWKIQTYFSCIYIIISLGILNIVINNDPKATEPKWYLISFDIAYVTWELSL